MIANLFPTPLMVEHFSRDFTETEFKFIDENSKSVEHNTGNLRSTNTCVLDDPALVDVRTFIEEKVKIFEKEILCLDNSELYITQSWINYNNPGSSHHLHYHPNSIISGVLYFSTFGEHDRIYFQKSGQPDFKLKQHNFNPYNSTSWWYPVAPGQLLLFPSSLQHSVKSDIKDLTMRISLSFNTFVKGQLGTLSLDDLFL